MTWGGADVTIIEIKGSANIMHLNHPQVIPHPGLWKNRLPRNQSLAPERLGATAVKLPLWIVTSVIRSGVRNQCPSPPWWSTPFTHPPALVGLRLYTGLVVERVSIRWISWAIAIAESNAWANGWCVGACNPFLETDADAVDMCLCLRPHRVITRKPRAVTDCLRLRREDGWHWSYCTGTWS